MFKAGAAAVDITPPLGLMIQAATHEKRARSVHSPLEANALYLAQGDTRLALVSCDLAGMDPEFTAGARERAATLAGIPPRQIVIACTHTHGGPVMMPTNRLAVSDPAYHAALQDKLAQVVHAAATAARPAQASWGRGQAMIGYNRRRCCSDGRHIMHGKPDPATFTGLEGPSDPQHTALFVQDGQGKPIAALYNNTSHPTTFYGSDCFSADFPGAVRALLRQALGDPSLPVLYLNGAQGDISMENLLAPDPYGEKPHQKIARIASLAAGETLRLLYESPIREEPLLAHLATDLELRVRLPTDERLAWARSILAKVGTGQQYDRWDLLFAHGAELLHRRFAENPVDRLPIHAIRIGDLALLTVACELYCQFGLDIKRRSPAPLTAVVGIADGSHGYCPTLSGIVGGGYSGEAIFWTRLSEDAGYRIVDEASRLLHRLWSMED